MAAVWFCFFVTQQSNFPALTVVAQVKLPDDLIATNLMSE